jgi:ferredoxin-NADP reductase
MTVEATITSIDQLTPDTKRFNLESDSHVFEYEPGQHTRVHYEPDAEGKGAARPYTATTLPDATQLTLAIKHYENGAASTYMHEREVGDEILIEELSGNLTLNDFDSDVAFVSTGVGITPMMAMLRQYLQEGTGDAFFFFGERDQDHLIYRETLDELATEHQNLSVVYSLSDPEENWDGPVGNIQTHLESELPTFDGIDFYICGVPSMVVDTQELLYINGVSAKRVFTEGWEEGVVQGKPSPLSIYDEIGGGEAVESVVERMYDFILDDDLLAPYFEDSDIDTLIENQSAFIGMIAGGPDYHHHIPETHASMNLRDEHFDAVLGHFHASLAEHDVGPEYIQQLKSQLRSYRESIVTAR